MAHRFIKFKRKRLTIHKATISPNIGENAVLATDTWDFVDLWLKRNHKKDAQFYWQQARSFYNASLNLPKTSSPLTLYYCFLNATKALLSAKGKDFKKFHGVSGKSENPTTLENEIIDLKAKGILPVFVKYLGYTIDNNNNKLSLLTCLYNLPFLHRTFLFTYPSYPELFIPIHNPLIVKHMKNNKAWFCAELDEEYSDGHIINALPKNFEIDTSYIDKKIIRCKQSPKRIKWIYSSKESEKINTIIKYNKAIRRHVFYIHGSPVSWYIKRTKTTNNDNYISLPPLILIFAAMHRLSELARYDPGKLSNHFECKQNWLLSEFLKGSPIQFIDEISSEITGLEFKVPKSSL